MKQNILLSLCVCDKNSKWIYNVCVTRKNMIYAIISSRKCSNIRISFRLRKFSETLFVHKHYVFVCKYSSFLFYVRKCINFAQNFFFMFSFNFSWATSPYFCERKMKAFLADYKSINTFICCNLWCEICFMLFRCIEKKVYF
jgi:hypothetical protein